MSTVRLPSPFTLPIKVYRVSLKSSRNLLTISLSSQACRHPADREKWSSTEQSVRCQFESGVAATLDTVAWRNHVRRPLTQARDGAKPLWLIGIHVFQTCGRFLIPTAAFCTARQMSHHQHSDSRAPKTAETRHFSVTVIIMLLLLNQIANMSRKILKTQQH